ncbi:hypothetical protein [Mycobacteroides abscessus]|nr:hypothetical protein [Mycobacteroides abscessus]
MSTLTTEVAVTLPQGHGFSPRRMLDVALTAVLQAAGTDIPLHDVLVVSHEGTWETQVDQGLPAWTTVHYSTSGDYAPGDVRNREVYPELYEDGDEYGDRVHHPACAYLLDFDTEDSYHGRQGQDGVTLHSRTIELLQEWVGTVAGSLSWRGQYVGEWHPVTVPITYHPAPA